MGKNGAATLPSGLARWGEQLLSLTPVGRWDKIWARHVAGRISTH